MENTFKTSNLFYVCLIYKLSYKRIGLFETFLLTEIAHDRR